MRPEAEPQIGHFAVFDTGRAVMTSPAASVSTCSTTKPYGGSERSRLMIDILYQNAAQAPPELHQH